MQLPDGVIITDKEGTIISVNNKIESLSGYSREDFWVIKSKLSYQKSIEKVILRGKNFAQNPQVREMSSTREFWAKRKDNSRVFSAYNVKPHYH
jgi:PAS domain S-box-containing protein